MAHVCQEFALCPTGCVGILDPLFELIATLLHLLDLCLVASEGAVFHPENIQQFIASIGTSTLKDTIARQAQQPPQHSTGGRRIEAEKNTAAERNDGSRRPPAQQPAQLVVVFLEHISCTSTAPRTGHITGRKDSMSIHRLPATPVNATASQRSDSLLLQSTTLPACRQVRPGP